MKVRRSLAHIYGQQFGRLTVVEEVSTPFKARRLLRCRCECGQYKTINAHSVIHGRSLSCGCQRRAAGRRNRTHGRSHTAEHNTWCDIKTRCFNAKTRAFEYYGGRGITMCERWRNSFEAFYADMGPKPSPQHSIDRINNSGHYAPDNCRWATRTEQRLNQSKGKNKRPRPDKGVKKGPRIR